MTVLLTTDRGETSGIFGVGFIGFVVIAGLAVAIFLLYRSMRTQLKRIDFNPDGTTDQERMSGHDTRGDGAGTPHDVRGGEPDADDEGPGGR